MDIFTFRGRIAERFHLTDAILLERIRLDIENAKMDVDSFVKDGNVWISRTINQFIAECPFLTHHLVRASLKRMESENLILVNRNDTTGKLRRIIADYTLTDKGKAWLNFKEEK